MIDAVRELWASLRDWREVGDFWGHVRSWWLVVRDPACMADDRHWPTEAGLAALAEDRRAALQEQFEAELAELDLPEVQQVGRYIMQLKTQRPAGAQ